MPTAVSRSEALTETSASTNLLEECQAYAKFIEQSMQDADLIPGAYLPSVGLVTTLKKPEKTGLDDSSYKIVPPLLVFSDVRSRNAENLQSNLST